MHSVSEPVKKKEKLAFDDIPSLTSFSRVVPAEPQKKNKKADKSSKNTRAVGKTTVNDDGKQGMNDAAADAMENQSDVVETKQNEDTQVTVQSSRAAALPETETAKRRSTNVRMTDELADEALTKPINDKQEIPDSAARKKENQCGVIEVQQHEDNAQPPETSSADTTDVRPLESKEESTNFQTTDEVADKASMKPKNYDRKQEMQHEDNVEEHRVRFEIPENAESKTEEGEKLQDKGAEPLVKIKELDGYESIKVDETYEPDNNIEALDVTLSNSLGASGEPLNPEMPNCGGPISSLLLDTPEPQRMNPVVFLLATVAIASVIFGFCSFGQQRE